jgi:hypothetical protein
MKMSKIITEREIDMMTNQPDNAGVPVFGHTQVDEAVRLVDGMCQQELRQFAEKITKEQAAWLFSLLDAARHERIRAKMLKSIMTVTDEEDYEGQAAVAQ